MSELDFQNFNFYDYFEPSEVDEIIGEASNKLMKHLKTDVNNRLKRVDKENSMLKEEIKSLKSELQKYKNKESELTRRERELNYDFLKRKWSELSDSLAMTVWGIGYESVLKQKCNCCDENRKIKFRDANGNEYEVNCKCNQSVTIRVPKEHKLIKMHIHKDRYKELYTECYYFDAEENRDDYICVRTGKQPLTELPEDLNTLDPWRLAFATKELAQEYCDWYNSNNEYIDEEMLKQIRIDTEASNKKRGD